MIQWEWGKFMIKEQWELNVCVNEPQVLFFYAQEKFVCKKS